MPGSRAGAGSTYAGPSWTPPTGGVRSAEDTEMSVTTWCLSTGAAIRGRSKISSAFVAVVTF